MIFPFNLLEKVLEKSKDSRENDSTSNTATNQYKKGGGEGDGLEALGSAVIQQPENDFVDEFHEAKTAEEEANTQEGQEAKGATKDAAAKEAKEKEETNTEDTEQATQQETGEKMLKKVKEMLTLSWKKIVLGLLLVVMLITIYQIQKVDISKNNNKAKKSKSQQKKK